MTGSIWFGGRADQILAETHTLNIVGYGGVSDNIKLVERFRNGELITFDFGSCELPWGARRGPRVTTSPGLRECSLEPQLDSLRGATESTVPAGRDRSSGPTAS